MTASTEDTPSGGTGKGRSGVDKNVVVGIVAVLVAIVALYPAWGSYLIDKAGAEEGPPPGGGAPSATGGTPTTGTGGTAPTAPAARWRSLWELPRTHGLVSTQRPDALRDTPGYDGARFMACSTNETSTVEQLTYQLDGRYAAFHASVRAWGDTTEPFRIVLKVHTTARQSDGTRTKNYRTFASAVANGPADTVEIRVPQAADLMLELECDRPHLQLVLSDARVQYAA